MIIYFVFSAFISRPTFPPAAAAAATANFKVLL
jgi:hypothetical protein